MKELLLPSRENEAQASRNVRRGLALFLILLIYDGALRKWVLPSAEQLLFVAKDALLFGLLIYVMVGQLRRRNRSIQRTAHGLFGLYAVWVLLESVNPNLPNVFVGIWGLKAHLLYASLILLLPLAFVDLDDLFTRLVRVYPWLVIPVCALAFVQLAAPADSFINHQVSGGMDMISYFGESDLVRVTGTFSYITGMANFVEVTAVLGLGLFIWGARSRWFLIAVGFALATLPATGSRGVIAVVGLSTVIAMLAAWASRLISVRGIVRIAMVIVVLGAVSLLTQDAAWNALQERAASVAENENDSVRAITAFTNAFDFFDVAGFMGFGSGSANLGAVALAGDAAPFSWLPGGIYFEEESGRVVLELGILGWVLSIGMRMAFLLWSAKLVLKGATRAVRAAGVLAFPVMANGVYVGNGIFSPPVGAVFYWFCVAVLAMARYEHRRAVADRAQSEAERYKTVATR